MRYLYSLSASAVKGQVKIYDANGDLAGTLNFGQQDAGANTLVWDCSSVPGGTYTFEVSAEASDGSDLSVTPRTAGKVTEVSFKDGAATLKVNGTGREYRRYDFHHAGIGLRDPDIGQAKAAAFMGQPWPGMLSGSSHRPETEHSFAADAHLNEPNKGTDLDLYV